MITPRWYQQKAEDSIFDYFATKQGNPAIAMPTASGKSIVIANFLERVFANWPNQRVIIATHVKELIQQNFKKMLTAWPSAPAGIYSAGLKQKNTFEPIIFGSIQSMVKHPNLFGWRDLLIIDEAHLVGHEDDTNYIKFIAALRAVNPNLKVIGLSATCWRMGRGKISDGPVFTDICYDLTTFDSFEQLINDGHLVRPIPKKTKVEINTSDLKITAGDYNKKDLAEAADKDPITLAACKEMIEEGYERISWLVFASSVQHAEHIAGTMQMLGIEAKAVHSKMTSSCSDTDKPSRCCKCRDCILDDFLNLRLRCCVNYGILTTGFDHPALDMIGMLRPTASSALWVQMVGRGMRPSPDTRKENCLVLDFAGNTRRLGPINDPVIPRKKGEREGVAPVRICDSCGCYNHARATICISCGAEFKFAPKLTRIADTAQLLRLTEEPVVEVHDVQKVIYHRHEKLGSPPMIKVSYWCGLKQFSEYVCLEHGGLAGNQAKDWWKRRFATYISPINSIKVEIPVPATTDEALKYISQAKPPRQIMVHVNKKYPQITAAIF